MSEQTPSPSESPVPPPASQTNGTPSNEDRTMGMLAHLVSLAGFVIPFGNIIGPLIVWLVKKDTSPFVDDQGKESINFQITITIAALVSAALITVCVGLVLLPLVGVFMLVFVIVAAVRANAGERYRYPFTLRLVK